MKSFANLFRNLDETNSTNEKVQNLVHYFENADHEDAAWATYFLCGNKPKQLVPVRKLCAWVIELAKIPEWLFDECYEAVGDLAETIALILPEPTRETNRSLCEWVEDVLLPLRDMDEFEQKETVLYSWGELDRTEVFVWNKLITGGFRVGVSRQLVSRALAEVSGLEVGIIAHRLMGDWQPTAESFKNLICKVDADADISRPYPFFLAHPLQCDVETLGPLCDWQVEWKWDGIRAQILIRGGELFIWSRGGELVTDRYPELVDLPLRLPNGTVLDGELLPWKQDSPLPFGQLQRRIGRKRIGKKLLHEVPVRFMAFDLLEWDDHDYRDQPLQLRREKLTEIIRLLPDNYPLEASPIVEAESWQNLGETRQRSRERRVEGLMLKRLDSAYGVGRTTGDWWKWKIEPYTIDAVLIYAQRGHGKRAGLYTDYTFGLWDGDKLISFAKAYSGLTDAEIRKVDRFIRQNTLDQYGPVRTVKPELVFELAFEGIQKSTRHKSGVAVRFPRMLRWRTDKTVEQANTLQEVKRLLPDSTS